MGALIARVRSSDERLVVALTLALSVAGALAVIAVFYGRYAIDDSYMGYANAQNLAAGLCFCFNPGERVLTTSAPLLVPVYAVLERLTRADIVAIGQVVSAASVVAIAVFGFLIGRRLGSPASGVVASLMLVTSPLIVLLWSHESLVCLALSLASLYAFLCRRYDLSAAVVGVAALSRPEALLIIPFLAGFRWRDGISAVVRYLIVAAIPLVPWVAYALATFGSVASESMLSKHAQYLYGGTPYLYGLYTKTQAVFSETIPLRGFRLMFYPLLIAIAALLAAAGRWRRIEWLLLAWFLLMTALYVVAQVAFFFWFAMQVPVLAAGLAAATWKPDSRERFARGALWAARICALLLVAMNVIALAELATARADFTRIDSMLVMPRIGSNAYYDLAEWLRRNTGPGDTVAYPEIGQLRYYSGRTIVDYVGLATPGVASHMLADDTIWAFVRYRPTVYVFAPYNWRNIVDPTEYDWFARAYRPAARLSYPGYWPSSNFVIYRLVDAAAVPPPFSRISALVRILSVSPLSAQISPSRAVSALEVRLTAPSACSGVLLARSGSTIAGMHRFDLRGVLRVRVPVADDSGTPMTLTMHGCDGARLAAPLMPRTLPILLSNQHRLIGGAANAVVAYGDR